MRSALPGQREAGARDCSSRLASVWLSRERGSADPARDDASEFHSCDDFAAVLWLQTKETRRRRRRREEGEKEEERERQTCGAVEKVS